MATSSSAAGGSAHHVVDVLRSRGHRNTQQRLRVYEAVLAADRAGEHPDTAGVYQRVRAAGMSVALASVYRALGTLEELGFIRRHQLGERSVYEPASHPPHGHIVDVASGAVTDFHDDSIQERMQQRSRRSGFELSHYSHTLYVRPVDKRGK